MIAVALIVGLVVGFLLGLEAGRQLYNSRMAEIRGRLADLEKLLDIEPSS